MIRKWALILAAWLPLSLLSAEPARVPSLKVITNGGATTPYMETRIYNVSPSFVWNAKHAEKMDLCGQRQQPRVILLALDLVKLTQIPQRQIFQGCFFFKAPERSWNMQTSLSLQVRRPF